MKWKTWFKPDKGRKGIKETDIQTRWMRSIPKELFTSYALRESIVGYTKYESIVHWALNVECWTIQLELHFGSLSCQEKIINVSYRYTYSANEKYGLCFSQQLIFKAHYVFIYFWQFIKICKLHLYKRIRIASDFIWPNKQYAHRK